ncbi:hypothetical protein VTJ83DRAFT_5334 [Remersonia thermophila]|uniref:Uncharacterized protein n=1 Tax=Remersonia thermophila TaxID=72144 RepID=A0ABR4D8R2_9PEZI
MPAVPTENPGVSMARLPVLSAQSTGLSLSRLRAQVWKRASSHSQSDACDMVAASPGRSPSP